MRIAGEIGQHRLGAAEGRFGIDHPFGFAERGEPGFECGRLGQSGMVIEENKVPGVVQGEQAFDEQVAKEPRQNPHMLEEPRSATDPAGAPRRQACAGHDHVDVGMVGQRRTPCVQHAVMPTRAPTRLGSAAMVITVSAEARNRRS
jgi:hypothetical protein